MPGSRAASDRKRASTSSARASRPDSLRSTTSARSRFPVHGPLGGLAGLQVLDGPAASARDPIKPDGERRIDEHHEVADPVPTGLQQDRGVQHDDRHDPSLGFAGDPLLEFQAHPGMDNPLEVAKRLRIGEDDRAEEAAIDPVFLLAGSRGGTEDLGAEPATTRSRTSGTSSTSCPTASASITHAPRPFNRSATRLFPEPMPPVRPITGIAPCFQRRGVGSGRGIARDEDDMGLLATRTCGS